MLPSSSSHKSTLFLQFVSLLLMPFGCMMSGTIENPPDFHLFRNVWRALWPTLSSSFFRYCSVCVCARVHSLYLSKSGFTIYFLLVLRRLVSPLMFAMPAMMRCTMGNNRRQQTNEAQNRYNSCTLHRHIRINNIRCGPHDRIELDVLCKWTSSPIGLFSCTAKRHSSIHSVFFAGVFDLMRRICMCIFEL